MEICSPSRQRQQSRRDPELSLAEGTERHREEQDREPDPDQDAVFHFVIQFLQPGARTDAEGAQVHGVDDVFAADDGMDGDGDHQRADLPHLLDESAADLLQLKAARFLRVHRQLEIAAEGRDEAHGQVHGVGDLVGQSQPAEGDPVQRGVERVGDQDRHNGDAEDAHELADPKEGALDSDVQRGRPPEDGEGRFEPTDEMLLRVEFHPAASRQEGEKREDGHEADDEQQRAADLAPRHARGEEDEERDSGEENQEAHVPECERGKEETAVEHHPGARIEGLDERAGPGAITPGD